MSELVICKEVRKVDGGYTVVVISEVGLAHAETRVRWPHGPEAMDFGTVVCHTWDEVIQLLTRAVEIQPSTLEASDE